MHQYGVLMQTSPFTLPEKSHLQVLGNLRYLITLIRQVFSVIMILRKSGLPLGKVFAGTDAKYNSSWTVTASHELLEMLGDPDINLTALVQDSNESGTLYAYETCDACEDDSFGYEINGVLVSDFVYPSWFEQFHKAGTQYDFQKKIKKAFELLVGGYIGVFKINSGSGWTQKTAQKTTREYKMRANVGSRRERRRTPRDQWLTSKI